jgi:hypothetical protein
MIILIIEIVYLVSAILTLFFIVTYFGKQEVKDSHRVLHHLVGTLCFTLSFLSFLGNIISFNPPGVVSEIDNTTAIVLIILIFTGCVGLLLNLKSRNKI